MGKINIKAERPVPGSRCDSCRHAHIIVGFRESETMMFCTYAYDQLLAVPFKVRDCSNYDDKNRPTWKQMEDLALPIKETTTSKTTGFRIPILLPEEALVDDE